MPYPYAWTDPEGVAAGNSYADENAVQRLVMSYTIDNQRVQTPDQGSVTNIRRFLIQVSAEIDAVLLKAGYLVPPPASVAILPILENMAAFGATAQLEAARFETGDDNELAKHVTMMQGSYDSMMGLIERGDINAGQMGMVSAGWASTPDRRKYYKSGNLEPLPDGTAKKPQFTMQTQW